MSDAVPTIPEPRGPARRPLRRLAVIGLATAVGGYVLACVGLFVFQNHLIYHPSREYGTTPADLHMVYEEVKLVAGDGVLLTAWHIPHLAPKATVLYFHGNGGNIADLVQWARTLHQLGCSVFLLEYRGYGHGAGEPSEAGLYMDAEAAWQYLVTTRGLRPHQIVLMGRSLGGAVAIYLAERHQPAALVVECTFTSLVDIARREFPYFPVDWLCRHRYESIARVPHIACPKLFFHGTDDRLIPIDNARRLLAAAAEPKEFIETPGDHNSAGFDYDAKSTQRLGEWLDKILLASDR